jgi:group I intron endonuclease
MKNLKMITNTISFSLSSKLLHCLQNKINRKGLHTLPVVPIRVYENADIQKLEILKDNKGKSGIYLWKNLESLKCISVVHGRIKAYYNRKHLIRVSNMRINRALLKWGYSSFSLSILEYCNKEDLIKREQYYLGILKPEYNICTTAGSTLGKLHSDKTKAKMAEARVGLNHSQETKAKMAEARVGLNHSQETKAKMAATRIGTFYN